MDSLKGKLREEAYKKDNMSPNGAGTLKQEYERLKAQPIREYVEGWDEQSYNAEFRRRQQLLQNASSNTSTGIQAALSTVNATRTRRDAAKAAFEAIKNSGVAATDATYIAAKNRLDAETAALATETTTLESLVRSTAGVAATLGADGSLKLDMSDIKLDADKARAERARQVEALRIAMEAAADAWVHDKALDPSSNTARDIQLFLSDNAAYINEHATDQIVVGYDANKNPIKQTISEVISRGFGSAAVRSGKFDLTDPEQLKQFQSQSDFEIEVIGKGKIMYKLIGNDYVPVDANGNRINDPDLDTYSKDSFFESIRRGITNGKIKGASSKSAISKAADAGKNSSTYTKTHEMADKKIKQRQAQENKGGRK